MKSSLTEQLERMHLQWFADAEEYPEGEPEVDNEPEEEEEFKIYIEGQDEIPEEPEEEEGPSKEELLAQLQQLQEKQSFAATQLGDRQTLEKGFKDLANVLTNQQQNQQQMLTKPTETWDQVKKRLAADFYTDPMAAIEEALKFAIQTEVAPAFHQTQDLVSKTAMSTSRQIAETNPTNKLILDKYRDEVDNTVKGLPSTPDVYEKACQQVGMAHFTEIMQEQVQSMMQEQPTKKVLPKSNVMPTGVASRGVAKQTKPRVLTKEQKAMADAAGITYEAAYRYFNEK